MNIVRDDTVYYLFVNRRIKQEGWKEWYQNTSVLLKSIVIEHKTYIFDYKTNDGEIPTSRYTLWIYHNFVQIIQELHRLTLVISVQ